jgi:hypothetical protein
MNDKRTAMTSTLSDIKSTESARNVFGRLFIVCVFMVVFGCGLWPNSIIHSNPVCAIFGVKSDFMG